jgi:hypothetical protein
VGHPKQPVVIDAKITEEYVICGVCLTRNRVVSHRRALRPVCGRCGYPLPNPFGSQPGVRVFIEWISRYRRALATFSAVLFAGLLVWLASGKEDHSPSLPGLRTEPPEANAIDDRRTPADAVAVVVRRETSTTTDDERGDLPVRAFPSLAESQSSSSYRLGTLPAETESRSESVVIMIDVCKVRGPENSSPSDDHDGELPGVSVLSHLKPVTTDHLNPLVSPHVVEQIHIDTGGDFGG